MTPEVDMEKQFMRWTPFTALTDGLAPGWYFIRDANHPSEDVMHAIKAASGEIMYHCLGLTAPRRPERLHEVPGLEVMGPFTPNTLSTYVEQYWTPAAVAS